MGYFDACVQPFRPDALGRRVIIPFGWFGPVYLVSDNDAERVRRGLKQLLACNLAALFGSALIGALSFKVVPFFIAGQLLWTYLLTRNLPRAGVSRKDLPRIPRREAVGRYYAAMGKPRLWITTVLMLAMNAFFIWGAVEFGGVVGWIVTISFTIVNGVMIFDLIRSRSNYNSPASPHSV